MTAPDPAAIEAIAREALAAWDENSTPHALATGALALAARNRRLVEALRSVEWGGCDGALRQRCPACDARAVVPAATGGGWDEGRHEPACALAALLAEEGDRG